MLSATFHDWGVGADDPDFSVDLTWSTATICTPEILYIIRRNFYTSQGDPDSSFPYLDSLSFVYILPSKSQNGILFIKWYFQIKITNNLQHV